MIGCCMRVKVSHTDAFILRLSLFLLHLLQKFVHYDRFLMTLFLAGLVVEGTILNIGKTRSAFPDCF